MITEFGYMPCLDPPTFWEQIQRDPSLGVALVLMLVLLVVMAVGASRGVPGCQNRKGAGDDGAEKV